MTKPPGVRGFMVLLRGEGPARRTSFLYTVILAKSNPVKRPGDLYHHSS
jgi:hypothetical protein